MKRRTFVSSAAVIAATASVPAISARQATPVSGTPVSSPVASPVASGLSVRLVDVTTVPSDLMVDETQVGGLSGIDFDPVSGVWYFQSDDRSDLQPARFYTGTVNFDDSGFTGIELSDVVTLLQEDGSPFPNADAGGNVPDPESIRVDPAGDLLWVSSEGSYELGIDPFVASFLPDGTFNSMVPMTGRYAMQGPEELGPRENLVFEGLTFASNGESLWIANEGPLFEDGPTSTADNGAFVRFVNIDRTGTVLREVAFELDSVPAPDDSPFFTQGVTEILALDDERLLVIVRETIADTAGNYPNFVQLWEANIADATDVKDLDSLVGAEFVPATRSMVIDFNEAGVEPLDNLEGITFGPEFANGNRSLVVVSDNNFNFDTQINQFVLLEVLGDA